MKLDDILSLVDTTIETPVISNNGFSINVFAPKDLYLKPGAHVNISSGFILNLPPPLVGFLTTRALVKDDFIFTKGQIIHPSHDKELSINVKYIGHDVAFIKKGEPLFQIILLNAIQLNA